MSEEEKIENLEEEEEEVEEPEETPEEDSEEEELVEEEEIEEEPEELDDEPEPEPEEEEYFEDAVNKGDFIKIEMTGRVEETGEIFETTDQELAEEEGIYNENRSYGPRLVIVGEGFVLRGLDSRLPGTPFDEETEIEIPPEEAFGERDPSNVETIPYRILRSKGINPVVGAELEIDGRPAIIRSVGAGRVQVDYNHPLAGRTIIYDVKVTDHMTEDEEKWRALIGRRFVGIETEKFEIELSDDKLSISIPDDIFFSENIQIAKRGVALDILRYFEDFNAIEFYETIERS
ncbi:peptidylprolyl isomerase [Candidatus Bathyarchaeota archaeon]|nr:peptidylprolyl isomerase [Candidatus Bathyarchaeota archaeon]